MSFLLHVRRTFCPLLLCGVWLVLGRAVAGGTQVPDGFKTTLIADQLLNVTTFEFAPDGRLFVSEQGGRLRVIKNGVLLPDPFLTVTTDGNGERGLLGIAFDPDFGANNFIYIYYTSLTPQPHNRVSRFVADGDRAVPGSEVVILDLNDLSTAANHNGGSIHFGPDGKLYISVGENAHSLNSQSLDTLLGKILRINPDGGIPSDNPFYNVAVGNNRAIWAMGLRNPFTFAFQPGTGRMFINDVGEAAWEEIDEGKAGANYGWPLCEAGCATPDAAFTDPIHQYAHTNAPEGGFCVAGAAFYNPTVAQFPAGYVGLYFFADYVKGWIRTLDPAHGNAVADFATGINHPVDLRVGPDGSLYYLVRAVGEVWNITFNGVQSPQIYQDPRTQSVRVGDSATFTVGASGTQPLSYQWQRDGSDIPGATSDTYILPLVTPSDEGAAFRCIVSNSAGSTPSAAGILHLTDNQLPVATIILPVDATPYSAGDTIQFAATGTDPEDGVLPASAFSWTIVFHHDTHTHPFLGPIDGITSGSFVVPNEGEPSPNVWYRVHLTVTDSAGESTTTFVDILPRVTSLQLSTTPPGLLVTVDGQPEVSPVTVKSVIGIHRTIGVLSPQNQGASVYDFAGWSDGGAQTHPIVWAATDTNYVAAFTLNPDQSGAANPAPILVPSSGSATPYPSLLSVSGFQGLLTGITVTLNALSHTSPSDLQVLLVGPRGQSVILMSDVGGGYDVTNINLTLDDAAPSLLPDGQPLVGGTYRPNDPDASDFFLPPAPPGPYSTALSSLLGTDPNGVWSLFVYDHSGGDDGSIAGGWRLNLHTSGPGPVAPTIQGLQDISLDEDTSSGPLPFTVQDLDSPLDTLQLTVQSSNEALIPSSNLVLGGAGANRTVTVSPAADQSGAAQISVFVSDGTATNQASFVITVRAVNDLPTLGAIADQTVPLNTVPPLIPLTVGDVETPPAALQVRATSSNQDLVPDAALQISGTGATRSLGVTPVAGAAGTCQITVTVTDEAGGSAVRTFTFTVLSGYGTAVFYSPDPITIPDAGPASPYPATLTVAGMTGRVARVVVTLLGLRHSYPGDLDVVLVDPSGQAVMLMSDAGSRASSTDVILHFDDSSSASLPEFGLIAPGIYKPTNYGAEDPYLVGDGNGIPGIRLADFNGKDPNGVWSLYVYDDSRSDSGVISGGWGMAITTDAARTAPANVRPPLVTALTPIPGGKVLLEVSGEPGSRFILDVSDTLFDWQVLHLGVLDQATVQVRDGTDPRPPFRLYRTRVAP
jgi:glucose/arabinose dehydrogenase/subtilisin-like proprotein convertase family protein